MISKECKRPAAVDFPIAVVSKHAARERFIRHGRLSTLHLRGARRPLASSRAVPMALLLPDRITIASFPGPDRSIRPAEPQTGSCVTRRYRNRRIGEFVKELKLTEGRGTGVPKILRAMRTNGSPPPEFRTDEDRTYFATILPVHSEVESVHEGSTPQVDPRERELLAYCVTPRDRAETMAHFGLRDREHVRQRYLQPLLEQGLLDLTQAESPRSPTQQYRTTTLWLAVLGAWSRT